jgi:hypothetical protein
LSDVFDDDVMDGMIDAALTTGQSADPVIEGLTRAFDVALPARLADRALGRRARVWWPARIAAAVLAYTMIGSGIVNIFFGHWLARTVGNAYAPHIYREGGLAFLAVGVLLGWAALQPRFLDLAVWVGTPLGLLLSINGAGEFIHLRAGVVDHGPQALSAIALVWFWARARRADRRYLIGPSDEEET